jgi:hypothetical protein
VQQFIHKTQDLYFTQAMFAIRGLSIYGYMDLKARFNRQPQDILATTPWFSLELNSKFETNYALREVFVRHHPQGTLQ